MSDNLPEVSKSITEEALWDSLPHEIVTHVFLQLPIKSIITCTFVSKTWKSLIQNPSFISTHLHHSSNNKNLILFRLCPRAVKQLKRKEVYALHWDDNTNFHQYTSFDDFPFHGQNGTGVLRNTGVLRVVGTCNGLICLADGIYTDAYYFLLWNPCVKKYVRLPNPNFSFRTTAPYYTVVGFGFGFDSKTNDYKVVRFVTPEDGDFFEGESTPKVEVYSLATGEWRVVTAPAQCPKCAAPDTTMIDQRLQAFVNGALLLVCYKTTPEIRLLYFVLVFDLEDEVFREIPLPKHSDMDYWKSVSILAYGNSIAMIQPVGTLDIWVLKNYADASSWTKIISLDAQAPPQEEEDIPRPKAFRKSGEVILETYRNSLVSRNLETQEVKDLGITGSTYSFIDPYVESLVLLDKPHLAVTY